ncbi:hypothetical protein GCM10028791_04340 [Echinicola sediminis]
MLLLPEDLEVADPGEIIKVISFNSRGMTETIVMPYFIINWYSNTFYYQGLPISTRHFKSP